MSDRRWRLLAFLTCSYAAGAFGVLGVSPLSPVLLEAFGLTRFQVGLLLPAVYVGGLVVSLPAGRLADRFGVRSCLLGGLAISGVFLLAGSTVSAFALLLACLVGVGVGWSIVNPALGRAIIEVFPPGERGVAMGIKQMGLTVGGIGAAVLLPSVAAAWSWRVALVVGAIVAFLPIAAGWRAMAVLARPTVAEQGSATPTPVGAWWWTRRPALLVFFATGFGLGMIQSAILGYLPLFSTQALGLTAVGAGGLVAAAQTGGAATRLGMGLASDRWLGGRRIPWLIVCCVISVVTLLLLAFPPSRSALAGAVIAFWVGVGTFGWVGLYLIASAEAGGHAQAGMLTGVSMAVIFGGILVGAPIFGLLLEGTDSYAVAWSAFAALAVAVTGALWMISDAMHRERK